MFISVYVEYLSCNSFCIIKTLCIFTPHDVITKHYVAYKLIRICYKNICLFSLDSLFIRKIFWNIFVKCVKRYYNYGVYRKHKTLKRTQKISWFAIVFDFYPTRVISFPPPRFGDWKHNSLDNYHIPSQIMISHIFTMSFLFDYFNYCNELSAIKYTSRWEWGSKFDIVDTYKRKPLLCKSAFGFEIPVCYLTSFLKKYNSSTRNFWWGKKTCWEGYLITRTIGKHFNDVFLI